MNMGLAPVLPPSNSGHKTKAQRQQEAMLRKRAHLDKPERLLQESVQYEASNPASNYAKQCVRNAEAALVRAYVEAGYEQVMAEGMARSVAAGGDRNSWLSQTSQVVQRDVEPTSVTSTIEKLKRMCPDVTSVLLIPHPSRAAIQIRADSPTLDCSMISNMSILEIDALSRALASDAIRVCRSEQEYAAMQLRSLDQAVTQ